MAAKVLGVDLHTVTFSEIFEVDEINWDKFAKKLMIYDSDLQIKSVLIKLSKS